MEDFEKVNKDWNDPHLVAPLLVKYDYLSLDLYLDFKEIDQADQGERDHEKEMIEDDIQIIFNVEFMSIISCFEIKRLSFTLGCMNHSKVSSIGYESWKVVEGWEDG